MTIIKRITNPIRQAIVFWPLLIPLVWFLPVVNQFPYPTAQAAFSDFAITHFPNTLYLKQSLLTWKVVPFWSPTILSGYPFAAHPLSGVSYPPGWLALLFPLPLGLNLSIFFHFLIGGLGMYFWMRLEGRSHGAALFAGMAFEAFPKIAAHYGAGHVTLLYAISWTPWLMWMEYRSRQDSGRISFGSPGWILALIALADIRWAPFAGLVWWGYRLWHHPANHQKASATSLKRKIIRSTWLLRETIFSFTLAAPLVLPLLEYVRISTRRTLGAADTLAFSLPPARLLGLVFPDFQGFQEWTLYPGIWILILCLLATLWPSVRRITRYWILVCIISLVVSLGSNIPGMETLARMPGLGLLRVPPRSLFLLGFGAAVVASASLDYLTNRIDTQERNRSTFALTIVAMATLMLVLGVALLARELPMPFIWGGGMVVIASFWLRLKITGKVQGRIWYVGLVLMCFVDLGIVSRSLFSGRSFAEVVSEGEHVANLLLDQPGIFRVYSPSYSLPQQTATVYDIQLAGGVDPLQLKAYADFMDQASGVPRSGYSVTIPPYANSSPSTDNASYLPDAELLGILNVRYILSEFDLPDKNLTLKEIIGPTRIFENGFWRPRAWVQPRETTASQSYRSAEAFHWSPNEIVIHATGPGKLVLSEIAYPGWIVTVNGVQAEMGTEMDILRSVELGPGQHQVVFSFIPHTYYLGLGLATVSILARLVVSRRSVWRVES